MENMILGENPRPDLMRKDTLVLNGLWDYGVNSTGEEEYDSKILVPFSPETEKSGIGRTLVPGETAYYRKRVRIEKEEGMRYILTFLAVDYYATVSINSREVMKHEGGYLPFSEDITEHISPDGNVEITVRVTDPTDSEAIERGKQTLHPHRIWYRCQSGIWQSVYLEKVPERYIRTIITTPDLDSSSLRIFPVSNTGERGSAELEIDGKKILLEMDRENIIHIAEPHLWSPENPYVYHFKIRYGKDEVESYTAMRKFSIISDEKGIRRLALNNRAIFHHGILDQGYMKNSLLTYESDEAIIKDLETVKDMGFNVIRKHIKIESPRWYYHATRLGLIVWQDMVNGGADYRDFAVTLPLFTTSFMRDRRNRLLSRRNDEEKKRYESFIKESIMYLYSVPCIGMWCIFNEGWGQFDSSRILSEIRKLDNTRTIDITSGWHDQGDGDFLSKHVYFRPYRFKKDRKGRCVLLSEFGGIGLGEEESNAKKFTYSDVSSSDELLKEITKMYERDVIPYIEKGLSASIYTQLSDVEQETNGLISYDRKRIKVPIHGMKELSKRLVIH